MPRSYLSLALAASSHALSREDRLTEIYALAIDEHTGFASEVFKLARLPEAESYKAHTQYQVSAGRLDLRVVGYRQGQPVAVLYGEHKEPGGRAGAGQRAKYIPELESEMRRQRVKGRLLWIVGSGDDPEGSPSKRSKPADVARGLERANREVEQLAAQLPHDQVVDKTWQDIAKCAKCAGRSSVAADRRAAWRQDAEFPSAPASQRILRELLWYLEEEGYAVTEGLTDRQLTEAPDAWNISKAVEGLLAETIATLNERKIGRFKVQSRSSSGRLKLSPPSWIDTWSKGIWLEVELTTTTRRNAERDLNFWVGAYIPKRSARDLEDDAEFRRQLEDAGLDFDYETPWIGASVPIRELLGSESFEMLDDQAKRLADWVVERLTALLKVKPTARPAGKSR